jgi:hypothetical protein
MEMMQMGSIEKRVTDPPKGKRGARKGSSKNLLAMLRTTARATIIADSQRMWMR